MSRNTLLLLVVLLGVGITVIGYLYYQETRTRSGIEIQIDEHGLTMEQK